MKKYEYPLDLGFRFAIQRPSGKHKHFRVIKRWDFPPDGKAKNESVEDEALYAINLRLRKDTLTVEIGYKEVELLVERLYRQAGVKKFKSVSNSDNQRLLDAFWEKYPNKRKLSDPPSTYAKYRRGVEALGEVSILSGSTDEMQTSVDKLGGNKQREAVGRLHTILRWLKRGDVILELEPEEYQEVRYLSHKEMEQMLTFIKDDAVKLACRVARGTGARIGELMFIKMDNIQPKTVFIKHQVKRDGSVALAKSKTADHPGRRVYVLPEARELVKTWAREKMRLTDKTRHNLANIVKAASEKAFPGSPEKWIKFHDLRHSYAIELAQTGVSLLQIAQQLGNSERICQKHYTGYMATTETIEMIDAKIQARNEVVA